jgi:hypothetical protein
MRPISCCYLKGEGFEADRQANQVELQGCLSHLDGGFDSASNRKAIFNAGLIPNIKENPRNRKRPKRGRKRLFNQTVHNLWDRVERTFAWEDKFKRLLLRFEHLQRRHYSMKLMVYTLINLRRFCGPRSSDRPLYTLVTSAIGEGRQGNLFKINTIIFFGIFSYSFISR